MSSSTSERNMVASYKAMVANFKRNKNRLDMIDMLTIFCRENQSKNVYLMKKKLETEFSLDVGCQYAYGITPQNYGCDFRELFFRRDGDVINDDGINALQKREELLDLFQVKAYLPRGEKIPHILTDIDDTLYPNHMGGIAGSDLSWIKKKHYPGIKRFYDLFYSTLPQGFRYSTVLSATPGPMKTSKLEDHHDMIKPVLGSTFGFIQGPESKFELTGYIASQTLHKHFGKIKFERCIQYSRLFPEYQINFIGDNGQGDLIAGKKMVEVLPDAKVFIHKIIEKSGMKESIEESRGDFHGQLFFFKNYLELAHLFKNIQLLEEKHLIEVTIDVLNELRKTHREICKKKTHEICIEDKRFHELFSHYLRPSIPNGITEYQLLIGASSSTGSKGSKKSIRSRKSVPLSTGSTKFVFGTPQSSPHLLSRTKSGRSRGGKRNTRRSKK